MRRIHPGPVATISDDELAAAYAYPDAGTWVRANMIATIDGAIRGADGRSGSIATAADRRVFAVARRACGCVLVGAGTVRAEDYRPSTRTIAVVSARLHLPISLRLFADRTPDHARPIIFTTEAAMDRATDDLRAAADIVACGPTTVDLPLVIGELASRGLGRILCEGGPSLLSDLVAADLLDEMLLTLSPTLVGAPGSEHVVHVPGGLQPARHFEPVEVLEEDGTTFLRLQAIAC